MKKTTKIKLLVLAIMMTTAMISKFVVVDVYKFFELNIVVNVLFYPTVGIMTGIAAYIIASKDKIQNR